MKIKSFIPFLTTGVLISNSALANHFVLQKDEPTFLHSLALQHYVNQISTYQPETISLNERLQNTINYYQRVHILKTVKKEQYTIDCIPFAEQPALLDNPTLAQELLPTVMSTTQNNLQALEKIGENFDFNTIKECPLGSIALLRPTKIMLTANAANTKIAPPISTSIPNIGHHHHSGHYTWEQGVTPNGDNIYIPTQASQAYFKGPQNQYVSPTDLNDHSLDQFWYTNYPYTTDRYTVEFGIIASSYFTSGPSTSIFVFASIDNYGDASCYNLECPNFIQSPGTPPMGVPITNKSGDYVFQVKHITTTGFQPGFYLTLVTHNNTLSPQKDGSVLLGYYPQSLYSSANMPGYFSAGAEVDAQTAGDGTIMYGNYANPYVGYSGPKQIGFYTENGNIFPYSSSSGPAPYGVIWNLGQS